MIFVASENLKKGMRLAKPIFNSKGVMLYDRNSKLTKQGIDSIRNFKLIGIYVLEPAEPLPPMTDADREFERFQTMSVFTLRDILQEIRDGKRPIQLEKLTTQIIRMFGRSPKKITFTQNLRSPEDNVYKHSLNTAILTAAIYGKLDSQLTGGAQYHAVMAALLHDIGSLDIPEEIAKKRDDELSDDERGVMEFHREAGVRMIREYCDPGAEVMKNITVLLRSLKEIRTGKYRDNKKVDFPVETLKVAYNFDVLTAMKFGEDPRSDIAAYKYLHHPMHHMNQQVVRALTSAINIVPVGCTVQFTDGNKGIVLTENPDDILRPFVLSFYDNRIYNLAEGKVYQRVQIRDVVKTMDNRYIMTDEFKKYQDAVKRGEIPAIHLPEAGE